MHGSRLSCLLRCGSRSSSMWPLLVQRNRFPQQAPVEAAKETHTSHCVRLPTSNSTELDYQISFIHFGRKILEAHLENLHVRRIILN